MPLIKCPMCEREISPNAVACPHCGEPMKVQDVVKHPSGYKVILEGNISEKIKLIKEVRELTGMGIKEAKDLVDNVPSEVIVCTTYNEAQNVVELLHEIDKGAVIKILENEIKKQVDAEIKKCNDNRKTNTIKLIYKVVIDMCPSNNKDSIVEFLRGEILCTNEEALKYVNYVPSVIENDFSYPQAKELKDKLKGYGVSVRIQGIRYGSNSITEDDKYRGGIKSSSSKYMKETTINSIIDSRVISTPQPRLNEKIVVKCPNCSSTSTNKISLTGRVASGLTFGIFSSSIGKTWKCNKCGYKW